MEHKFSLNKRLAKRTLYNSSVKPTNEQERLALHITHRILGLLVDYLIAIKQTEVLVADVPFHLFEIGDELCDTLGLDRGCCVMLELIGKLPRIVWNDNDLGTLQRKNVLDLRRLIDGLKERKCHPADFALLTGERS